MVARNSVKETRNPAGGQAAGSQERCDDWASIARVVVSVIILQGVEASTGSLQIMTTGSGKSSLSGFLPEPPPPSH